MAVFEIDSSCLEIALVGVDRSLVLDDNLLLIVAWPQSADPAPHLQYVNDYWNKLSPFTDGFYMNEVSDESLAVVEANYQGTLARMRALKTKYDSGNLFRLNPNVAPRV